MQNNIILAVIVLYKEQLQTTNTYLSLCQALRNIPAHWQVELYLHDNSPIAQTIDPAISAIYVHRSDNPGLSVAYNEAARYATNKGIQWLLLLDQDTTVPADLFSKTISAISTNDSCKLFAPTIQSQNQSLISPFRTRCKVGQMLRTGITGEIDAKKYAVINSGIMVQVKAFNDVGGYCDAVKLDFSDTVFIERYGATYSTLFITKANCIQHLSAFDPDKEKLKSRFVLFCKGARTCPKDSFSDRIGYFIVVFKRLLSLTIKTKSITFASLFWTNYVKR